MKLFLIRHAQAVELGAANAASDFDRYLTDYGRATAAQLADLLNSLGVRFDAILCSPYVRAVQTAEPLLAICKAPVLKKLDELGCGAGKPGAIAKRLDGMTERVVALVGHSPDMDELAAWLIGAEPGGIHLAKGTVAKLNTNGDVRKAGCTLCWQVSPKFYFPQPAS
jgi:phosphohistidine phosphatase